MKDREDRDAHIFWESASSRTLPNAALIKAIARGYRSYERLICGKTISVEALAAEVGLTKRYVNRVIRFALLAPDIVERILAGRQPPELTLNRLFRHIPLDWAEQRRVFGIDTHHESGR